MNPNRKGYHSLLKTISVVTGVLALTAVTAYKITENRMLPKCPKKEAKRYALLLGCPSHNDGTLSRSQLKRCHLAIKAWDEGLFDTLIISGGAVKNQYKESEAMADYIRFFRDMPIVQEDQARNTWQNFEKTKALISDQPVLVLTSSLHARRACAIANQFFSDYSVMTYPDWKPKHIVREYMSRLIYFGNEFKKTAHPQKEAKEETD